ncbi:hypothetical protein ILYODFUR_018701 [Ilyodon furcidens]|uniref:Uncharacterized protein n=1 Tax=Ilyodon furcidens TaxID=33524 RepID=A0ABV0UAN4_9TELE
MRHWDFTLSCTKSFQRCCSLASFHTEVSQLQQQQKASGPQSSSANHPSWLRRISCSSAEPRPSSTSSQPSGFKLFPTP